MTKPLLVFVLTIAVFIAYEAAVKDAIDYVQAILLGIAAVVGWFIADKMRARKDG